MADALNGYRILILETREEAQFSKLLAEKSAVVVQCPMFAIHDAPDPAPIIGWIKRQIESPFDDIVLMTGEGVRRMVKLAQQSGLDQTFVAALGKSRKFCRGPKPGRALRELSLEPQQTTEKPTTEGVIQMLEKFDLKGHRLGLQLYPDKDHSELIGAIRDRGADVDSVLPYVYDPKAADGSIVTAIDDMAEGRIDALALTNLGQVRRLFEAAKAQGCEARLRDGLKKTLIASVGPAVTGELAAQGLRPDVMPPENAHFMRPLISAMAAALSERPARRES